jgi:hypothetical protein
VCACRLLNNKIGTVGAKAVADALRVNVSLTRADVRWNAVRAEGEEVLHKAIEGRSGFELKL